MIRALPANMSAETARAVDVGSDAELRSCSVAELATVEVERCARAREFFAGPASSEAQGWAGVLLTEDVVDTVGGPAKLTSDHSLPLSTRLGHPHGFGQRLRLLAGGPAARTDAVTCSDAEAAAVEATWRERALDAEQKLRRAHGEITLERGRIGELLAQIRDLEADLPPDGVQQLLTETHTLNAQRRQLTQDNRPLEERLAGARDNNRFLDKRIATLEADLADRTAR